MNTEHTTESPPAEILLVPYARTHESTVPLPRHPTPLMCSPEAAEIRDISSQMGDAVERLRKFLHIHKPAVHRFAEANTCSCVMCARAPHIVDLLGVILEVTDMHLGYIDNARPVTPEELASMAEGEPAADAAAQDAAEEPVIAKPK
jgi:hypothetical protein